LALLVLAGCSSAPPDVPVRTAANRSRIIAGDTLYSPKLVHYVRPVYPPQARKQRIEGTVRLKAVVTRTGDLRDITVLQGHPLLAREAVRVASQWRYAPVLLRSEPVEVATTIDIPFTLSQ
jgi:protein TonB